MRGEYRDFEYGGGESSELTDAEAEVYEIEEQHDDDGSEEHDGVGQDGACVPRSDGLEVCEDSVIY